MPPTTGPTMTTDHASWITAVGTLLSAAFLLFGFGFTFLQLRTEHQVTSARFRQEIDELFFRFGTIPVAFRRECLAADGITRTEETISAKIESVLNFPSSPSWDPHSSGFSDFTRYVGLFERIALLIDDGVYDKAHFDRLHLWKFHALFVNRRVQLTLYENPTGWLDFVHLARLCRKELRDQDDRLALLPLSKNRHDVSAFCSPVGLRGLDSVTISVADFIDALIEHVPRTIREGDTSTVTQIFRTSLVEKSRRSPLWGRRISVQWPLQGPDGLYHYWFAGTVVSLVSGLYNVLYDEDGTIGRFALSNCPPDDEPGVEALHTRALGGSSHSCTWRSPVQGDTKPWKWILPAAPAERAPAGIIN